jgi:hypothetical protein
MRRRKGDGTFTYAIRTSPYCTCQKPLPGAWNVECMRCYRLIDGAIRAVLTRARGPL